MLKNEWKKLFQNKFMIVVMIAIRYGSGRACERYLLHGADHTKGFLKKCNDSDREECKKDDAVL